MSDNKNTGRGIYGKGYYIALILCAAAIGITGFLYYRSENEARQVLQEPEQQMTLPAAAVEEDVPVVVTQPQGTQAPAATEPTAAPKKPLKTAAPISGETVAEYAMDCLSYNETTRDWRVHNGVDLAAEAGTEVMAAADGVVYTTYDDDMMGTTVVIRHEDGYTTVYSSLAEELKVSTGDRVTLGQAIGCVGETALIETGAGPHVHFSVLCNDAAMDPAEFLALGSE